MRKTFLIAGVLFIAKLTVAQVGIGTNQPHGSSILELNSTTKGFLPPRMTTDQRNAINLPPPPTGLIIFNTTTNRLEIKTSSGWASLVLANDVVTNVTGTVAVANGGTGVTSVQGIKNLLDLSSTSVYIGTDAGKDPLSGTGVGIGYNAGNYYQGDNAIAIGYEAGRVYQGDHSIAIGNLAGSDNQPAKSIALNSTGRALDPADSGLYIAPIRSSSSIHTFLGYDTVMKEVRFIPNLVSPSITGGSSSTQSLIYKTTSGLGGNGADHIFQVGNNGATEALRILNNGIVDVKRSLRLSGTTSGFIGLQPPAAAGSTTYTLPASPGSSGQFLMTDGVNGNATLNWADAVSAGSINVSKLADGAVTSAKILDATIVNDDISATAGIVDSKLATISSAGKVSNSATTATSANTANAIIARDANGDFSARTINARDISLNGIYIGRRSTVNFGPLAIGYDALKSISTSSMSSNTAIGYLSMYNTNEDGDFNTAVGNYSLYSNTDGGFNTAVGKNALIGNTTGDDNTAIGESALRWNSTGSDNVAIGAQSQSSTLNTTGSQNILIGSGTQLQGNFNNSILIGYNLTAAASNTVRIGNLSSTSYGIYGTWSNLSDARSKHDIIPLEKGLDLVKLLKPVQFVYNSQSDEKYSYGFLAQDVKASLNDVGATNSGMVSQMDSELLGMKTDELIAVLVKAVQEQQAEIEKLKAQQRKPHKRKK